MVVLIEVHRLGMLTLHISCMDFLWRRRVQQLHHLYFDWLWRFWQ